MFQILGYIQQTYAVKVCVTQSFVCILKQDVQHVQVKEMKQETCMHTIL